jgi:hypothetical protein
MNNIPASLGGKKYPWFELPLSLAAFAGGVDWLENACRNQPSQASRQPVGTTPRGITGIQCRKEGMYLLGQPLVTILRGNHRRMSACPASLDNKREHALAMRFLERLGTWQHTISRVPDDMDKGYKKLKNVAHPCQWRLTRDVPLLL